MNRGTPTNSLALLYHHHQLIVRDLYLHMRSKSYFYVTNWPERGGRMRAEINYLKRDGKKKRKFNGYIERACIRLIYILVVVKQNDTKWRSGNSNVSLFCIWKKYNRYAFMEIIIEIIDFKHSVICNGNYPNVNDREDVFEYRNMQGVYGLECISSINKQNEHIQ